MDVLRKRGPVSVVVMAAIALVAGGCAPTPTGFAPFSCTTSIGELPQFELADEVFNVRRPAPGGAAQVFVDVVHVEAGAFDFVLWDVLDVIGYEPPMSAIMFMVEQNPTHGIETTSVQAVVYADTPVGNYGLKIRGLAYTGSFFEGPTDLVGECFARFVISVTD